MPEQLYKARAIEVHIKQNKWLKNIIGWCVSVKQCFITMNTVFSLLNS